MKKKRLLSFITSAVIAVTCFGGGLSGFVNKTDFLTADAATYDDYLCYNPIDEDDDGNYDCIVVSNCDESAVSIDIPSEIDGLPVTHIKENTFSRCSDLKSVTIPDSVTSIGSRAFFGCSNLESIAIPGSIIDIGDEAFRDCINIVKVVIPNDVATIGK